MGERGPDMPSTMQVVPAHTASRLIRSGKFARVYFHFVTRGGATIVRTPKARAKEALRRLGEKGGDVALELDAAQGDATIYPVGAK